MDPEVRAAHLEAGRLYGREATCGRKVAYSENSAMKAAESMNAKSSTRKELEAYPCYWCGQWHIGRKMDAEELASFTSTVWFR